LIDIYRHDSIINYSGIIAREQSASFLQVFFILLLKPAAALESFFIAFGFMDIVFYVLAAYVGFSTALDLKRSKKYRKRATDKTSPVLFPLTETFTR
jgi:hypothetical protein